MASLWKGPDLSRGPEPPGGPGACSRMSRLCFSITSASCRSCRSSWRPAGRAAADITHMRRRSDEQQALVVQARPGSRQLLQAGPAGGRAGGAGSSEPGRGWRPAQLTEQVERLEAQYAELVETKASWMPALTPCSRASLRSAAWSSLARAKESGGRPRNRWKTWQAPGDPDAAARGRIRSATGWPRPRPSMEVGATRPGPRRNPGSAQT